MTDPKDILNKVYADKRLVEAPLVLDFMKKFLAWCETVDTLVTAAQDFKKTSIKFDSATKEINANISLQSAFDKYGHVLSEGMTCPVCGKHIKYLTPDGYCSFECFLKDLEKKAIGYLTEPTERYKQIHNFIESVAAILDHVTLLLNSMMALPEFLTSLVDIPDVYKDYVNLKINENFCRLQVAINEMLIKKNEYISHLLEQVNLGVMDKAIMVLFAPVAAIEKAVAVIKQAFDAAYTGIMQVLLTVKTSFTGQSIPAEGIALMCTPRSFISPMPYTSPDASKLFVNLPGGAGLQDIKSIKPLMPSALTTLDPAALTEIIKKAFPPLTNTDFYLDPELFAARLLLSDKSDLPQKLAQMLEDFLSAGPDYVPKFENMLPVKMHNIGGVEIPMPNVGYIWFLLGLMDGWAAHSQALFGSILNPAV